MGKKDKEHRNKVKLRNLALGNPIARKTIGLMSHKNVVAELTKGSPADQSYRLMDLVKSGALKANKLSDSLKSKAVKEMDKAIKDFQKRNKDISVASLTEEARNDKPFIEMCNSVGITIEWFENLAHERIKKLVEG